MKKTLLLLLVLAWNYTQAQICEPDAAYAEEETGIYPLSDSVNSPVSEAYQNLPYEFAFTVVADDSITFESGTYVITDYLVEMILDTIKGLPTGFEYACEPEDCIFPNSSSGCILISGMPDTTGVYDLNIEAKAKIGVLSFPIPAFEYQLTVGEDTTATNLTTPINDIIGMRNIPNPFSTQTEIMIESKESGEFDFKVYNLIGKLLHQRDISLSTGTNSIQFDGSQLHSGLYFYTLGRGKDVITKRMVIHHHP